MSISVLRSGLVATVVLSVAALVATTGIAAGVFWLSTFQFGGGPSGRFTGEAEDVVNWIHSRDTSLYWLPLVAFWTWLWLAYRRLRGTVAGLKYSPLKAVLAFVTPVLNLWQPVPVLRELWRASERHLLDPVPWRAMPTPMIAIACWAAYEIGMLVWVFQFWLEGIRQRVSLDPGSLMLSFRLLYLDRIGWVAEDVAVLVGAVTAIIIVMRVTDLQAREPVQVPAAPT